MEDEEEEEMETYETKRVEQEFDFKTFVQRFAVQSVCTAYAIIFDSYAKVCGEILTLHSEIWKKNLDPSKTS